MISNEFLKMKLIHQNMIQSCSETFFTMKCQFFKKSMKTAKCIIYNLSEKQKIII